MGFLKGKTAIKIIQSSPKLKKSPIGATMEWESFLVT